MRWKKKVSYTAVVVLLILALSCAGDDAAVLEKPNVILLIIDTLRADHLSCYGYSRETSPTIDSLAQTGTRWDNCQAQGPWTPPTTASIMSGLNAMEHGTGRRIDGDHGLDREMPVIPVLFSDDGYQTCGIFNIAHLNKLHGYSRGFDHYSCVDDGNGRAAETVDEFLQWLETSDEERPFLAVLHFLDVHHPYDPPPAFKDLYLPGDTVTVTRWEIVGDVPAIAHPEHLEHFLAWYDGEIRWVDSELGRLTGELRTRGYAESTIIMLVSDHGEEFLERGWVEHGQNLYQEMIRVPLIASGPGIPSGEIVTECVGQFDVLPTLLALCNIGTDASFSGIDLFSDSASLPRPIPASRQKNLCGTMLDGIPIAGVNYDGFMGVMIQYDDSVGYFMFDLQADPGEIYPLPADSVMIRHLDYYWATPPIYDAPAIRDLEQMTVDALRDLGYI